MIAEQNQNLPKGWALPKLGDLVEEIKTRSSELDPNDEFSYIDITSIDNELKKITSPKRYQWKDAPSRAKQIVKANDIVFSTVRTYLKNIALVPALLDGQIASTGFCVIRGGEAVHHKFLFYYTLSISFIESLNKLQRGTSYPAVRDRDVFTQLLPLPPRTEQKRIVDKIEELFSDLDSGIDSLKTAQQQLKVYRQAVLKWAFEGKLTAQWREEQKRLGKLEPAEVLLAQIKAERERRYQQELEDWKTAIALWEANGKEGKRPGKPSKPKESDPLVDEELADLETLPEGWFWIRLGNLTWSVKDGPHYSPKYSESGIPFISGGNVRPEGVDFQNVKFITPELHQELSKRCKPDLGDILYTKGGTTGIARVNTYNKDFNVWVHVAVLKIIDSALIQK
jgi:type I restriction enzyme, S subunit